MLFAFLMNVSMALNFRYGLGIVNSEFGQTKLFAVNSVRSIDYVFEGQYEVGIWNDTAFGTGRNTSGYVSASWGPRVEVGDYILIRPLWGLAFITTPDIWLGGRFPQFSHDLFLGVRGKNGSEFGVTYKHVSSAGLCIPNKGRDFIALQYGFEF